ncbi:CAAX amino terminal protease family [Striga asiatica]|uniref:CAAX amino terminal protease family n=1 Tax=Striga asiatica TaxID=4170 RepID=A0A5A7P3V5_STRAF|nr:CAAX amino terminal protease family [Striga asiatica]
MDSKNRGNSGCSIDDTQRGDGRRLWKLPELGHRRWRHTERRWTAPTASETKIDSNVGVGWRGYMAVVIIADGGCAVAGLFAAVAGLVVVGVDGGAGGVSSRWRGWWWLGEDLVVVVGGAVDGAHRNLLLVTRGPLLAEVKSSPAILGGCGCRFIEGRHGCCSRREQRARRLLLVAEAALGVVAIGTARFRALEVVRGDRISTGGEEMVRVTIGYGDGKIFLA